MLASLPTEICVAIFRLLDPIGLIAIAQTCSRFRSIIRPNRRWLVDRILAQELQELQERDSYKPHSRSNRYVTSTDETVWACSGCMQLLPWHMFDSGSLRRFGYRKPQPGTPASKVFTAWEPDGVRKAPQSRVGTEEDRLLRQQYGILTIFCWTYDDEIRSFEALKKAGAPEAQDTTVARFLEIGETERQQLYKREASRIEGICCGYKRHLRRCLECKFKSNKIRLLGDNDAYINKGSSNRGSALVPVIFKQWKSFIGLLDRYFPKIEAFTTAKRPAASRELLSSGDWPLVQSRYIYVIRCPHCQIWQEGASFHFKSRDLLDLRDDRFYAEFKWRADYRFDADDTYCLSCFCAQFGRKELACILLARWKEKRSYTDKLLNIELTRGWSALDISLNRDRTPPDRAPSRETIQRIRNEFYDGVPWTATTAEEHQKLLNDVVDTDRARLNRLHGRWLELPKKLRHEVNEVLIYWNNSYRIEFWEENYQAMAEYIDWVSAASEEFEENPEELVEWALGRHPTQTSGER